MKLIALTAAGVLAATALTPVPAEAQRHGWHGDRGGWHGHRGWRSGQGYHRGWRGRGYYRGGYGGWNRGGWNRGRTVCRWDRGYYGRVRHCYRVRY